MPINFFFIMGLLLFVAGLSFTINFRFGRIAKKFKGQHKLQLVSLFFLGAGVLFIVIGIFQML